MRTVCVSPDFPLNRRMRKAVLRGKLNIVRKGESGGGNTDTIAKSHIWRPIEDMPAEFSQEARAAESELQSLSQAWQKRQAEMDPQELKQFNRELNREWSIETGLIERAYRLERGTTRILIQRGFEEGLIPYRNGQDPAEVTAMLCDHENVVNALFGFVTGERELSVGYVKELHAEMLRAQKTVAGVDQFGNKTRIPMNHGIFKKRSNNPFTSDGKLHEYCPPEQVDSEMDRLMEMHKKHSAHSPLASAAWLHHRFVQIHPFEDGNGRVVRCLASLVFIRAGLLPLVVPDAERDEYLDSLDEANKGDLSPLICSFAKWQKRFYFKMFPAEVERKLQAIRDIPADSVGNILSKINATQELALYACRSNILTGWETTSAHNVVTKLEEIRSIAAHSPLKAETLSGLGKLVELEAEDSVELIKITIEYS